jgi:hypothetical protein
MIQHGLSWLTYAAIILGKLLPANTLRARCTRIGACSHFQILETTKARSTTKESGERSLRDTSCPLWWEVLSNRSGAAYCGLLVSPGGGVDAAAGIELVGATGSAVAGEVCEVGVVG